MKSKYQIFAENLLFTFLSIIKIILISKKRIKLPIKEHRSCIILGNGPSLNSTVNQYSDFFKAKDIIGVNYFVRSELYTKLKPNIYILASPEYWKEEKKEWNTERFKTFEMIARKTHWRLSILVPQMARNFNEWKKIIHSNPNIQIYYYNNTPTEGFTAFNFFAYKHNLAMPRPHNVLIPSLMVSINMNYEYIFLAGADHSWLPEITVNNQNEVLLSQKHFYDNLTKNDKSNLNKPDAKPMFKGGSTKTRKLHEILEKFVYAFRAYWEIKAYAERRNIKIINITPNSYIDAFPKQKPDQI